MEAARLARLSRIAKTENNITEKVNEVKKSLLSFKITNVSASMTLGIPLPLGEIVLKGHDVEYIQSKMDTLETQLRTPKIEKVKIYPSGKMVVLGARSLDGAHKGARRIARRIQKLNYKVRLSKYKVFNIFSKAQVPYKIDLDSLKAANEKHCIYDLEDDHFLYYYKDRTALGLSKDKRYKSLIKFTRNGKIIIFALNLEEMVSMGKLANELAEAHKVKKQLKLTYTVYEPPKVELKENSNAMQEDDDILTDLLSF